MSFFTLIDKLRAKSDTEKKKITFVVSATVTGFIFIIWIFTFVFSASTSLPPQENINTPSPFAQISESFSKIFDSMTNIFKQTDAPTQ